MNNANTALIQSLYAAFGRGEVDTIVAAVTADVHWQVNGRTKDFPVIGSWRGPAQVRAFFRILNEHEAISEFTPQEFYAADDKVFVLGHYVSTIRKTGRKVESDWLHVFTIKGGMVSAFKEFFDTAQLAEAFRD